MPPTTRTVTLSMHPDDAHELMSKLIKGSDRDGTNPLQKFTFPYVGLKINVSGTAIEFDPADLTHWAHILDRQTAFNFFHCIYGSGGDAFKDCGLDMEDSSTFTDGNISQYPDKVIRCIRP